jgi:chemosensory pili system protein ChpA (sensor histidine kinase/response regulator)
MSISPQSALSWLSDEALKLLQEMSEETHRFDATSSEQTLKAHRDCLKKLHAIVGAFDVANCHTLVKYCQLFEGYLLQLDMALPSFCMDAAERVREFTATFGNFLSLKRKKNTLSEISLFSHYKKIAESTNVLVHPSDLWFANAQTNVVSTLLSPEVTLQLRNLSFARQESQTLFDGELEDQDLHMLRVVRSKDAISCDHLKQICDRLIVAAKDDCEILFGSLLWTLISSLREGEIELDLYVKRAMLGSLNWLKGRALDESQTKNLAFFAYIAWQKTHAMNAEASPVSRYETMLHRLGQSANWQIEDGVDYTTFNFTKINSEQIEKLDHYLERVLQSWSKICAPELSQADRELNAKALASSIEDCTSKLAVSYPSSVPLSIELKSDGLLKIAISTRSEQIEVATVLMTLRAVLQEAVTNSQAQTERYLDDLAKRLQRLLQGDGVAPAQAWMVELQQRQVWSDTSKQVVDDLKQKLVHVESSLTLYWSQSKNRSLLGAIPEELQQLGLTAQSLQLDDFAKTAKVLQNDLDAMQTADESDIPQLQRHFTANLAAMALMLDLYDQNASEASQSFQLDEKSQMLEFVTETRASPVASETETVVGISLEQIFLEEARDLVSQAKHAVLKLEQEPGLIEELITLRRSFHTLKGGARVGNFNEFAESAWLLEQCLNTRLSEHLPASNAFLAVCAKWLEKMEAWVSASADSVWNHDELAHDLLALNQTIDHTQLPSDWLDLPAAVVPEPLETIKSEEELYKVVGDLKFSHALYNAYLNETDEWSRQLEVAMSEWAVDDTQPIPVQSQTWAHALAGSSATVGFYALANFAKLVEKLIDRVIDENFRSPTLTHVLAQAAQEMSRVLHQFAAGFLKIPDEDMAKNLQTLLTIESTLMQVVAPQIDVPRIAVEQVQASHKNEHDLQSIFDEEASQLVPELGTAIRQWTASPKDAEHKAQALRILHTLKGSARLVGQNEMAENAHDMESYIESMAGEIDQESAASLLGFYDQLQVSTSQDASTISEVTAPSLAATLMPNPAPRAVSVFTPTGETIRVRSNVVDRIVNQTGEIMISRSRMSAEVERALLTLGDLNQQVQRLREQLRELELQTESQMQSRKAQVGDQEQGFDPLEFDRFTRAQELTRFMAEALSDISILQRNLQKSLNATEDDLAAQQRQTRDLQRNLLSTRMVAFESIAERLHRLVRLSAQDTQKMAALIITGGALEMDRSVLERMLPAFEHLLRNAIVHGVELPQARLQKNKSEAGHIQIQLSQQGSDVVVKLIDDGAGIDTQAVKKKARALGRQVSTEISGDEASQLIFLSGLSTAEKVSEIAGRGIGMDVVRAQVQGLGGRIEVHSKKDAGTTFMFTLPLTTAVTQIALVRSHQLLTAIPVNLIVSVVRVKPEVFASAQVSGKFEFGKQSYDFYDLNRLLARGATKVESLQPTSSVILLKSANQTIALYVDEVLGNQEAVVKNLGPQLSQMPGLSGMTVLPTGQTVLIYNPVALATVYGKRTDLENIAIFPSNKDTAIEAGATTPLILVVDDSITMRSVLQRLVQREGYRVAQAADGKQALDMLRTEKPALVLSDVEMPRMDGFELLRSIRSSEQTANIPIVMITSRIADKHRDHAIELGATAYLGKPYQEEELVALIHQYALQRSH